MFKWSFELLNLFGFKIRLDPSWLLIAALIIWSLSTSYFPEILPGYSQYDYIAIGTVSMLGLFASLILHELAHSMVARRYGLRISGITLFVFGGVAELEDEPKNPSSEFWIAIAGPIMSFLLAGLFFLAAQILQNVDASKPLHATVHYLAIINMVLACFNLIPAFPLDGGRIFRAILWYMKNDVLSATSIASAFGSAFGFILIVSGIFSLFTETAIGGLWQILIGFFVVSASRSSYRQLLMSAAMKDQDIRSIMTRAVHTAQISDTVEKVIQEIVLAKNVTFVPAMNGNRLVGFVTLEMLQEVGPDQRSSTPISDIYRKLGAADCVHPDTPMEEVYKTMLRDNLRKMLVEKNGHLLGVITLADMLKFLAIREGLKLNKATMG